MKKKIKVKIIKNVYWDDWGTMRTAFRKGWTGWVDGSFENDNLVHVSGESPVYRGVSDEIWKDYYEVIEVSEV